MNNVYDIMVQLKANVSQFKSGMVEAQTSIQNFEKVTGTKLDQVATAFTGVGKSLTKGLTVPIGAAAVASVKAAMNMETAMAGVAKTTDLTADELANMKSEIKGLSEQMPIAATEIAGVAEAAGQLGIEKQNIISFTETMVGLGTATDMSSEEAATALARLANITGMPQTEFDKLGSTVVELGNNMAATESEIVNMSLRLAGTGSQVGLTEAQILGLSGAMTSMGINAEAGGSAMSQTMQHINTEVLGSGENLAELAKIAGVTAGEFSDTWRNDPMKAISLFVGGLGEITESGGDVAGALDDAGISGLRQVDVLGRLSGGSDILANAVTMSNEAWKENTALNAEVAAATDTTAARMEMLWNKIVNLAESIGEILLPMVDKAVNKISEWVDWFSTLDTSTQETIVQIGLLVAAVGPVLIIVGKVMGAVSGAIGTFTRLNEKFGLVSKASGLLGKAAGLLNIKFIAIVAVIAAVVAAGVWLYQNWDLVKEKAAQLGQWLSETWTNIKTWTIETWTSIKESIVEAVTSAYNSIVEWFGQLPGWFSETWNSITESVTTWVSTMIEKAIEVGSKFLENVMTFFSELPYNIGFVIGTVIGLVAKFVIDMVTKAYELGSTFLTNIVEWFKQLPGRISSFLSSAWSNTVQWASNMWSKAKELGANFINAVVSYFSQLPGRIATFTSETWNKVTTWVSNMVTKAKEMGSRFLTAVISFFQQLPGRVQTWLANVISRVTTWGTNLMTKGREAGRKLVDGVINVVKTLPGKILSAGKDVVKGFWNGITSMGSWLTGKVTNFFGGIIDGVKGVFGIKSPSRVFRNEIGAELPAGAGLGIEDEENVAVRAMQSMVDNVLGVWDDAGLLSAQVGGMVGHTVTQEVSMNNNYTAKPAYINLAIGGQVFRAFVADITSVQDGNTELELDYS